METIEMLRGYMGNDKITVDSLDQVRLEETGQTFGVLLTGEGAVVEHLRTLAMDNGNEWHGIDTPDLYNDPQTLRDGLRYLGENNKIEGVWYQAY